MERGTINSRLDSTQHPDQTFKRRQQILEEWSTRGESDMVATLREYPELLQQRSLLMELAIDEYEARSGIDDPDFASHCVSL